MRRWIAIALLFVVVAVVATVRIGPRFSPIQPGSGLPTFKETFGYSGKVTDYQPAVAHSARRTCGIPGYPEGAQVILLSAGRGQAMSSVSVGGQDVSTTVARVVVEPGDVPLYVVGMSTSAVIWRFSGATQRIRRLVLSSSYQFTSTQWGTRVPLGEIGLPRDTVTFLSDPGCMPSTANAANLVKDGLGHAPSVTAAHYVVTRFLIPSGDVMVTSLSDSAKGRQLEFDHLMSFLSTDPLAGHPLDYEVAQAWPDGLIWINPDDVVASLPVERYDILPGIAGLQQLVARGALTEIGNNQYHVERKIRLPADVTGMHFLLGKDVEAPDGKYNSACVISHETGQPISSQPRNVWPAC